MAVKSKLFEFWQLKEIELGHRLTVAEAMRATGLHRDSIQGFLDGDVKRFDEPTLNKLCKFFNVPPGPVSFLVYEPDGD